jgi:hypothetical protein
MSNKYFVTTLGTYTESMIRDMSFLMIPMVSENHLKFHYNSNSIVFHFQSEWDFENVHNYCNQVFFKVSDVIIVSKSDSTEISMDDLMLRELLDLETETEDATLLTPIIREMNGDSFLAQDLTQDDEDDDEEDDDFIQKLKTKTKTPTLDEILDKICEFGINSLKENELHILNKHSN